MSQSTTRKILLGMVIAKIIALKSKSRTNKLRFQWLTAGSIIFSAAIALTLGLELPNHVSGQKNIALVLSMALTIINGWVAIFDYKKLWVRQKSTLLGLYQLENELNILTDSEQDQDKVKALFNTYQALWKKDGDEWVNIQNIPASENKLTAEKTL